MEVENIFQYYLNIAVSVQNFLNNEKDLPNKKELQAPLEKLKKNYESLFENEGLIISYIQYMSDRINDPNQQAQALLELEVQNKRSYLEKKEDNVEAIMPDVKILMNRLQDSTEYALGKDGSIPLTTALMIENQMHSKLLGEVDMVIKELLPEAAVFRHHNLPAPPTMEFLDKKFNDISSSMTKVRMIALDDTIPELSESSTKLQDSINKIRDQHYNNSNKNGFKNN